MAQDIAAVVAALETLRYRLEEAEAPGTLGAVLDTLHTSTLDAIQQIVTIERGDYP